MAALFISIVNEATCMYSFMVVLFRLLQGRWSKKKHLAVMTSFALPVKRPALLQPPLANSFDDRGF